MIIGQRDTVTVVATTDEVTAGASGTHSVVTTATSVTAPAPLTAQTTPTVITVSRPLLEVTKYVRNTNPGFAGADPYVFDGITWYRTGVTGNPGHEMEYLIVVDNSDADATLAANIVISDPIPQFTTYVIDSIRLDDDGTALTFAAFADQADADNDDDAAEYDAAGNGTVIIYAGVGGDDTTSVGGELAQGESSRAVFRVTID